MKALGLLVGLSALYEAVAWAPIHKRRKIEPVRSTR